MAVQEASPLRALLSPRLMETCVWALARWTDTYLLPEEPLPGALQQVYGDPAGPAVQLLDGVVRVALACLVGFPGEAQLHGQVCGQLLPVLVRRRSLCRQLVQLGSWQELAGAFATRQPAISEQMGQKLHRSLAQSLCMAAAGLMGPKPSQAYITHLMHATAAELAAVASRPDLLSAASHASQVLHVCRLLESMRGATRATLSATQPALFALTTPLLQPLLRLQHAFRGQPVVVGLLLKLAAEVVENHISFLRPAESDGLMRWVLELLQLYSQDNRWTRDLSTARTLQEEHQAEQCRDLQALLKLLCHVTQRDVAEIDIQRQQQGQAPGAPQQQFLDAAQVVLLGLNIVLPLMSLDLLKYPKLCHLYFHLLSYMLEVYAAQVASLQPSHFGTIMQSLDFGLQHSDPLVAQASLEGLAGMARHQHKARQQGAPGFSAHLVADGRSCTAHFLELLLRRLLLEDMSLDLVELAADALLPLLMCETDTFQQLCSALGASHPDPGTRGRVMQALGKLMPGAAPEGPDLARHTKRVFRQSLCGVVSEVRGLVRLR